MPLSTEQMLVYQKQLVDAINKLKQTLTDGKDKAKSLEHIIFMACNLKSDFTMTLFSKINPNNTSSSSPSFEFSPLLDLFIKCMRYLLLHRSSYIRSLTVRCLRYIVQYDPEHFPIETLWSKYNCHLLIFKMMLNDTDREKIQVLELIRTLCNNVVKRKNKCNSPSGDNTSTPTSDIPYLFMKGIVHFLNYIDGTLLQMEQQQQQQGNQPTTQQQQQPQRTTSNTNTATTNNLSSSANDQKKQYFLESYKSVCIEILRDGLVHDEALCDMIIKCGGLKYLVELLLDNKFSIYHTNILSAILYICDKYKTRKFMKKGLLDLQYLISPFNNYSQLHQQLKDAVSNAAMNNPNTLQQLMDDLTQLETELDRSKFVILYLMRSWTGLFIVNQPRINILGTLANLLKVPNRMYLKHLLLDMYIEILKQSVPSKYHHLIPPIFTECAVVYRDRSQSKSSRKNKQQSSTTTANGVPSTLNTSTSNLNQVNVANALNTSLNSGNTTAGDRQNNIGNSGFYNNSFSNDVTFYADHSADEDRIANICFIFLSMTISALIDSGLIDSLLHLSKQSMISSKNNKNAPVDPLSAKDKLNIGDDEEDKGERAFISFRASQLLQSILLFSDMLLSKRTCLTMQDRFDTEIANFLVSISKSNLYSYKTLSMLSAFYQQSFNNNNTGSNIQLVDTTMIQAPTSLSVSSSANETNDSMGDKFSKFSTTNIPSFYIRTQIDSDMDDQTFNQLIRDSNILVTKDSRKWNWEKIYCLIFGPLRVAHRLKEVTTKQSKLLKRILSYFKPYKKAFSELKYQESNFGYTKLCNELLYNLLHMDDSGIGIIKECNLVKQFYEVLEIEVRAHKALSSNAKADPKLSPEKRVLNEERVQKYMVRDYFTIIGLMSSTVKGKELLEEEKIFDVLKDLTTRRDDICQLIIKHLDYTKPFSDRSREILKEAMMHGSNIIRYISTLFIRNLIRQQQTFPNNFHLWGIPLLTSKLYDEWEKVKFSAISILSEVCCMNFGNNSTVEIDFDNTDDSVGSPRSTTTSSSFILTTSNTTANENLRSFVSQNISRDIMESVMREGKDGMNLLLKMTSCREGIDYLGHDNVRLLQELLEEWYERESFLFLQQVEYGLNRFYHMNTIVPPSQSSVGSPPMTATTPNGTKSNFANLSGSYDYAKHGVILQSNLYGELCHTLEGCTILTNDKNRTLHTLCVNLLSVYQRVHAYTTESDNDSDDGQLSMPELVQLWSLAFCCSTNTGYEYCNRYIQQVIIGYEKIHQPERFQQSANEQYSVAQYFSYIALNSRDLSLRGNMLYLLGILSKCSLARRDLTESGFECSFRYAISIPKDRKQFFNMYENLDNPSEVSTHELEEDQLLKSILQMSQHADLIVELVSNVTKIANPVQEHPSYVALQALKTKVTKLLPNEKAKLIYYLLGHHFTFYKYKWKVIKFVINDLLGGNSSMLSSSIATSESPTIAPNTAIEDELYVMNAHLLWLDEQTNISYKANHNK